MRAAHLRGRQLGIAPGIFFDGLTCGSEFSRGRAPDEDSFEHKIATAG